MAFFLAGEAEAIAVALTEAAFGVVVGIAGAVIGHHNAGDNQDSGVACDNNGEDDDGDTGKEDDTPKRRHADVIQHAEIMELVRSNEVGIDHYREHRKKRFRNYIHHVRKHGWEYAGAAAFSAARAAYMWNRRYRDSLSNQEADFQRRAIRYEQLRHNAPHQLDPFGTPTRTPPSVRRKRAHTHAYEGFLFSKRRY